MTTQTRSEAIVKSIADLMEISQIGDNWDGDGAIAPEPDIVRGAINFLCQSRLIMPNRIVPVNNGTIALEWYNQISIPELEGYEILKVETLWGGTLMHIYPDGITVFTNVSWKEYFHV